jgi:predicted DsbA family dithiol-disulfide isomerase
MGPLPRHLEITVYQDVLCPWCYVAEARLEPLRRELGDAVRWNWRPYALRIDDGALSEKERASWSAQTRRAQREPEGAHLSDALWIGADAPSSSVPPLLALEAARLQGEDAYHAFLGTLRRAALEQAVNVARRDVLFEIAGALRLDMNRFTAAFQSPETRRLVVQEYRMAAERGVRGAPALVLGNRWMICGLRELSEYRTHLQDCLRKHQAARRRSSEELLH